MEEILRVEGLVKDFGGVRALGGLDLSVTEGLVQSVIGPNGAGKTTLFNVVSGVFGPTSGEISFMGRRITKMAPHRIAAMGVTRTFQNLQLFSEMTVLENVMVGMHLRSKGGFISSALKLPWVLSEERRIVSESMEILRFVGLDVSAGIVSGSLPFGRQRLLELARALASGPRLILLDEPAAGLNSRETEDLADLILRVRNERSVTVLLVEHDMELVMRISDLVTVIDRGRQIAQGEPEEVRNDPKVLAAYLGEG